ncbi:DUF2889 domain-containing protein [Streptomyces sp. KL116D]|uniref:DUF2889 domain-containing protein n=1 Tax=Streptomyces sp. KL116D TaxID=3045152 RepID=UPI0035566FE3
MVGRAAVGSLALHSRTLRVDVHAEGEEFFLAEAELRDERPWADDEEVREAESRLGPAAAIGLLHHMELRVRVRREGLMITESSAEMRAFPHDECPLIAPVFGGMEGLSVTSGYTKALSERFRGASGCSHLHELARVLGPAVIQASISASARRRALGEETPGGASVAGVRGSCHVWADGGVGERKLEAGWKPGTGVYPVPQLRVSESR